MHFFRMNGILRTCYSAVCHGSQRSNTQKKTEEFNQSEAWNEWWERSSIELLINRTHLFLNCSPIVKSRISDSRIKRGPLKISTKERKNEIKNEVNEFYFIQESWQCFSFLFHHFPSIITTKWRETKIKYILCCAHHPWSCMCIDHNAPLQMFKRNFQYFVFFWFFSCFFVRGRYFYYWIHIDSFEFLFPMFDDEQEGKKK